MDLRFFDLQVNGYAGVDFQQPDVTLEQLETAAARLRARQTPKILLTLITDEPAALALKLRRYEAWREASPLCRDVICGYHLEGPYLSPLPGFHGAHPPELMKAPDADEFASWQDAANGHIRLVTLAPEWPGSPAFIRKLSAQGVRSAIGHSNASRTEIRRAIEAGLTLCTHLGNGLPAELPRHDNIVQRLLSCDELVACFIPDGIHVPAFALKNYLRCKPPDKILFTTDCMAAADEGPGTFRLGRLSVEVGADGIVRQPGKPNFAGSAITMPQAWERAQSLLGLDASTAHALCGSRVADCLGLSF